MRARPKLLIVDDQDRYVELCHALLQDYDYATRCELPGPCWECDRRQGCELTHAHDAEEAKDALQRHPDTDVVLLDVAFDIPEERLLPFRDTGLAQRKRLQGLAILEHLRRDRGELPVILMTSIEELEFGQAALAGDEFVSLAGADAFDARALSLLVERTLARRHEAPAAGGYVFGRSKGMARLRQDATTLARTSLPVLIVGETGTGKSALAEHVIHPASGRNGPFRAVDLSAIPSQLLAAELFGTVRGAFSGAVERTGLLVEADGGTLLLDEIGNLPLDVQRMLLLTLQTRRVTRLGESASRTVDVKLVAATNSDLERAVHAGEFRGDLYARLNPSARLTVPPLRERIGDVRELAQGFVERTFAAGVDRQLLTEYQERAGIRGTPRPELQIGRDKPSENATVVFMLSRASFQLLRSHDWPGNVRELEMVLNTAVLFALADALRAAEEGRGAPSDTAWAVPVPARLLQELLGRSWGRTPGPSEGESFRPTLQARGSLRDVARDLERQAYTFLFERTGGDFEAMARLLLEGGGAGDARKVRLRFNQLGLSVKNLRKRDS
ncbi:MAG: sigma 54-interacting transcriptional regulator [Myxococcota bacterium]